MPKDAGFRMSGYFVWGGLEDPTLFFMDGRYHMVLEDNKGQLTGDVRHGAQLVSRSGRTWQSYDPIKVYTHTIQWTDDASTTFDRRERPELVNLNNPPAAPPMNVAGAVAAIPVQLMACSLAATRGP